MVATKPELAMDHTTTTAGTTLLLPYGTSPRAHTGAMPLDRIVTLVSLIPVLS